MRCPYNNLGTIWGRGSFCYKTLEYSNKLWYNWRYFKNNDKNLSHYATWFNVKYLRSGSLFSNRYKSEPVEDERYFLGLTRYIGTVWGRVTFCAK